MKLGRQCQPVAGRMILNLMATQSAGTVFGASGRAIPHVHLHVRGGMPMSRLLGGEFAGCFDCTRTFDQTSSKGQGRTSFLSQVN
jgi:hypothetical protein